MKVKSPMDGMVSIKENQDAAGGMMVQGMTLPEYREGDLVFSGRFLAEILDTNQMEVAGKIYENDRSNINAGQTAEIRLDTQPEAVLAAKVKTVAGMTARNNMFGGAESVRRFDVSFELTGRAGIMRPGTSAQIVVRGNQLKDQLYLPSQCLFDKDGKLVVYVKHGDKFDTVEAKTGKVICGGLGEQDQPLDPRLPRQALELEHDGASEAGSPTVLSHGHGA